MLRVYSNPKVRCCSTPGTFWCSASCLKKLQHSEWELHRMMCLVNNLIHHSGAIQAHYYMLKINIFWYFVTNNKYILISSYCMSLWPFSIITEAYSRPILHNAANLFQKQKTAESTVGEQSQVSARQQKITTLLIFSIKRKVKLKRNSFFS